MENNSGVQHDQLSADYYLNQELYGGLPLAWMLFLIAGITLCMFGIYLYRHRASSVKLIAIPFTFATFVAAGLVLGLFVHFESQRYFQQQSRLAESYVHGVVQALEQLIRQKRMAVDAMIRYEQPLLEQIAQNPRTELIEQLRRVIQSRLPEHFTFILANPDGSIIHKDNSLKVGPNCISDIMMFSAMPDMQRDSLGIHGFDQTNFHYDVISFIDENNDSPILTISFQLASVMALLQHAQLPDHQLVIDYIDNSEQILITGDKVFVSSTNDADLASLGPERALYRQTVANTAWEVYSIPDKSLFVKYRQLLVNRSLMAYGALAMIVLLFLIRLLREERFRLKAEAQLREINQQLEQKVDQRTRELLESESRMYSTFMSAPFGMMVVDDEGRVESFNRLAEEIFGYSQSEIQGQLIETLIPQRYREQHVAERDEFKRQNETRYMGQGRHLKGLTRDGREIPVEVGLSHFEVSSGKRKIIASISDTSELISVYNQLTEEHERALVTLNSIVDGVISTDINGNILSMNPVGEKLTGWSFDQANGIAVTEVFQVVKEGGDGVVENPALRCLQSRTVVDADDETELIHRSGMRIPVEHHASPIHDTEGDIIGAVLVFHDVTQSRAHAHEIEYQANHDALTGLLNRREFDQRLNSTIKHLHNGSFDNVLLFLDLDRFKLVNDTAGHAAGDELLKQLTRAMQNKLRARDTFARLGGDEFGVLLEHCSREVGLKVGNTLRQTVEDFRFFWKEQVFSVGVSIGMVSFSDATDSADDVLSNADAACYTAKESGRNRVQIYDAEAARKRGESSIVNMLSEAYEHDRMRLYQQRIRATTGTESHQHYEILIRMLNDDGEILHPGMFLPAAERYGLATTLDRWVVKSTIRWLEKNQEKFESAPILAINLSGQSITDVMFRDFVHQQLVDHQVPGELLCFEVTETATMNNINNAREFIADLKQMGCAFALDDFGSGHASYAHLKNLPVDYLKIDGMFVKDISNDPINYPIVKSVNEIGQVLGIKTVAEFVENDEIISRLTEIGVDYLQGYGIARPAPLDDLLD